MLNLTSLTKTDARCDVPSFCTRPGSSNAKEGLCRDSHERESFAGATEASRYFEAYQFDGERWPGPICRLSLFFVPKVHDLDSPTYIVGDISAINTLCSNPFPFRYVDDGVRLVGAAEGRRAAGRFEGPELEPRDGHVRGGAAPRQPHELRQ